MRPGREKGRILNSVYTQIFITVAAFAVMCVLSLIYIGRNEQRHLFKDSENALSSMENILLSRFLEYETFLNGYSQTIRSMIMWGVEEVEILDYMISMTNYLIKNTGQLEEFTAVYGYFFTPGGKFLSGSSRNLPDDFIPQNQPWFNAAIEAGGNIVISRQVTETRGLTGTRNNSLTFSNYLTDENGNPLAIICLDIELSSIIKNITAITLTDNSYGILINDNLDIIAHPEPFFIGLKLHHIDSGLAGLTPLLERGMNIREERVKNYTRSDSIVYFQRTRHRWYIGIVIPVHEYYRSVYYMVGFLSLLASLLALTLSTMLYQISKAKKKSDLRTQQKSNFLATMSHEIRTPLNAILGMTEIQMQNTVHPPATSEAFIKINNSGNLLLNIINDILDLSKIEGENLN
jgi:hypothetical protein